MSGPIKRSAPMVYTVCDIVQLSNCRPRGKMRAWCKNVKTWKMKIFNFVFIRWSVWFVGPRPYLGRSNPPESPEPRTQDGAYCEDCGLYKYNDNGLIKSNLLMAGRIWDQSSRIFYFSSRKYLIKLVEMSWLGRSMFLQRTGKSWNVGSGIGR